LDTVLEESKLQLKFYNELFMRRVNPFEIGAEQDNYFIHIARYLFCARQLKKTDSVLEIGCGFGYGARLLADYAKQVFAHDKEQGLDVFWKKFNQPNLFFMNDFNELNALKKFDVVVSFEVVEHIEEKKLDQYFKLIKNHLKPKGTLFISTPRALPFEQRSKNRQLEHKKEYSPNEFRELLEKYFTSVFLFSQNDSVISTQNYEMAWNLVAICVE